jgi:hypothetical protein
MLQAVSTARDTQRQLAALRSHVLELTQQAQQLQLQEEVVVTRVRGEAALATTIMEEEATVRGGGSFCVFHNRFVVMPHAETCCGCRSSRCGGGGEFAKAHRQQGGGVKVCGGAMVLRSVVVE